MGAGPHPRWPPARVSCEVVTGEVEEGLGEEVEDRVERQGTEVADHAGGGEAVLGGQHGVEVGQAAPLRCGGSGGGDGGGRPGGGGKSPPGAPAPGAPTPPRGQGGKKPAQA